MRFLNVLIISYISLLLCSCYRNECKEYVIPYGLQSYFPYEDGSEISFVIGEKDTLVYKVMTYDYSVEKNKNCQMRNLVNTDLFYMDVAGVNGYTSKVVRRENEVDTVIAVLTLCVNVEDTKNVFQYLFKKQEYPDTLFLYSKDSSSTATVIRDKGFVNFNGKTTEYSLWE